MGSSGSEYVDFGVGSIVWVRRRNGSWWPGKILGPNELSNNHLMSPRSGTPVKLLGREDASVDWYNLEKSKRVKPFRCGDFDECIERAESSVGMQPKKREKYARREDAILHALELEKQMLDNHGSRLDIPSDIKSNKSSNSGEKGSITSSGNQETSEQIRQNAPEHENGCHPLDKTKETTLQEGEAPLKMRGLQEFGLRTVPSKRKVSSSFKSDEIDRPKSCHQNNVTSAGGYNSGRNNHINLVDVRKTTPESLIIETSVRDYYRYPPAVQVSQNNAHQSLLQGVQPESQFNSFYVSAPDQIKTTYPTKRNKFLYLPAESHFPAGESNNPLHVSASDDGTSGFSEDTESDASASDSETDSDEEMNALAGHRAGLEDSTDGSEAKRRHGIMSNNELDALADELPLSDDGGASKWKFKGKRNVRHVSKRSSDIPTNTGVAMNDETYLEMRENNVDRRIPRLPVNCLQSNDFNSYLDGDESFDRDSWSPGSALGNTRYPTRRRKPSGRSDNSIYHFTDWDDMTLEHRTPFNGYLMESRDYYTGDCHGQAYVGRRRSNMLIEVDLKVQSTYPKQRVPIISLMSKLDGRAIIGHPLQIEELEEGSSATLTSKRGELCNGRFIGEIDYAIPSFRKTSRRTANYRVPRPDLSIAEESGGDADYLPHGRKPASMYFNTSLGSLVQKIDPFAVRPPAAKKPTNKYSKKISTSSSQKTRTLSSISISQDKQIGEGRYDDAPAFYLSEFIKSESGTSTASCIPVNFVFSRLHGAVGRRPEVTALLSHEA